MEQPKTAHDPKVRCGSLSPVRGTSSESEWHLIKTLDQSIHPTSEIFGNCQYAALNDPHCGPLFRMKSRGLAPASERRKHIYISIRQLEVAGRFGSSIIETASKNGRREHPRPRRARPVRDPPKPPSTRGGRGIGQSR